MHWASARERRWGYFLVKSAVDRLLSLAFIVLLTPLYFGIAVSLWFLSDDPVLFIQYRIGQLGRPFKILKFRTMRIHPVAIPATRMKDRLYDLFVQFLRTSKWDETPQLVNVLLGDMSLIGPRPLQIMDNAHVKPQHLLRYALKPGLTGLWQVNLSKAYSLDEKLRLDAIYVRKAGPLLDLRLLSQTLYRLLLRKFKN